MVQLSFCLAWEQGWLKLNSRPDVAGSHLEGLIQWMVEILLNPTQHSSFLVTGVLFTFVNVYQKGTRKELLQNIRRTMGLIESPLLEAPNTVHRKLFVKLLRYLFRMTQG